MPELKLMQEIAHKITLTLSQGMSVQTSFGTFPLLTLDSHTDLLSRSDGCNLAQEHASAMDR